MTGNLLRFSSFFNDVIGVFSFCIIYFIPQLVEAQGYFQQYVNYNIKVELNDKRHELSGFQTLTYTNNSTMALKEIYFHLYPNAYKNNSTALAREFLDDGNLSFEYAHDSLRGFIDGLSFKVDNSDVKMVYDSVHIDICRIILNQQLESGSSIVITTPFKVKIPDARFSRLGHTGQAYYISQWYPKPAVFDKNGWNTVPYLTQGEFYGEFGSYEVSITLPSNYVVGASGNLQEESERKFLMQKSEETKRLKYFEKSLAFPESSTNTKTITYRMDSVHDFAWFADKRFHVLQSEVQLPQSENKVTTYAMFTNSEALLWLKSTEYINNAIYYYSLWNGDYPYKVCTAIDGVIAAGGGMEYPGVTIIGKSNDAFTLEDVIVHEVGHNWFYGILGTNERKFAWMDEGINSFNEQRYFSTKYGSESWNVLASALPFSKLTGISKLGFKKATMFESMLSLRNYVNQPLSTPAKDFTNLNYGLNVYSYTAALFEYLKEYLGQELFDRCMKSYFKQWKFRHPYPEDLKKIFETESGRDLTWFFDDLIGTDKKIDYSISGINERNESNTLGTNKIYSLKLENKQKVNVPFSISTLTNDSITSTEWYEGFEGTKNVDISCAQCDAIVLNATGVIPDINNRNNQIKTKGILKKVEPIKVQLFPRVENPSQSQLFVLPVVAYNAHNGLMAGLSISNYFLEKKKLEYHLTPMYGFNSGSLAGLAMITYTQFFSEGFLHHISYSLNPRYFTYLNDKIRFPDGNLQNEIFNYLSVPFSIKLYKRKKSHTDNIQYSLNLRHYFNGVEQYDYSGLTPGRVTKFNNVSQLVLCRENKNKLDPHNISLTAEAGEKYMKTFIESDKYFSYGRVKKGIKLRFFAGAFIYDNSNGIASINMSAWSGRNDYLFNDYYFARNDASNFLNQQVYIHDGGMKAYAPGARSNKWLVGLNAEVKIPSLPVKFFADVGTYANAKNAYPRSEALVYSGGIAVTLIKNICEVYFPLVFSNGIKEYQKANDLKFGDKIRFTFNIQSLNLLNLRQNLLDAY